MLEKLIATSDGESKLMLIYLETLRIYALDDFRQLLYRANDGKVQRGFNDAALYIRWIAAEAMEVAWDDKGAVEIPRRILDKTGFQVGDDLVIAGMRDWIEVWRPDAWEAEMKKYELSDEQMALINDFLNSDLRST